MALLTGCVAIDPVLTFLAGEDQQEEGKPIVRQIYSGSRADSATQNFVVVRSQQEWDAVWVQLGADKPGPLPRGKMAIVVMLGERPTGGYKVEIDEIERDTSLGGLQKMTVTWREYAPSPKRMHTQQITSPWVMRIVDAWPNVPEFVEESTRVLE